MDTKEVEISEELYFDKNNITMTDYEPLNIIKRTIIAMQLTYDQFYKKIKIFLSRVTVVNKDFDSLKTTFIELLRVYKKEYDETDKGNLILFYEILHWNATDDFKLIVDFNKSFWINVKTLEATASLLNSFTESQLYIAICKYIVDNKITEDEFNLIGKDKGYVESFDRFMGFTVRPTYARISYDDLENIVTAFGKKIKITME